MMSLLETLQNRLNPRILQSTSYDNLSWSRLFLDCMYFIVCAPNIHSYSVGFWWENSLICIRFTIHFADSRVKRRKSGVQRMSLSVSVLRRKNDSDVDIISNSKVTCQLILFAISPLKGKTIVPTDSEAFYCPNKGPCIRRSLKH